MRDLVVALGLVAVIEGLLYAASPALVRRAYKQMMGLSDPVLRTAGVVAMAVGVAVVWIVRHH